MKKFPGKVTIMWEKRFPYSTTILSGVCLLLLWTAGSQAAIQNKTLASLVARDQGILPGSRITEVLRLDITETDTSTPDNPVDDGAATLESLEVSFSELLGTEIGELSTVSLYRIGQPIDDEGFDFQRDFKFSNNQLIRRQPVDSALVRFENLNETILNTKAIFFIAITTDVTLDNNDEFSVIVGNIVVTHPESTDPKPNLKRESETLTCVDFAGDLMPEADYVRSNGIERDFPFAPHNYKDFSYQHPDALNELYDLEVPTVLPAESRPTAVLGIELAGVRSELQAIRLNFTSVINGVNNDNDYFIDEDYYALVDGQLALISQSGVYDPFIDELVRDVDKDGFFSAADVVLYPGINGFIDAERKGVDDDGDGLIDEEKRNHFRLLDGFDLYEVNEDRDFYIDENGDGRFSPGQDEVYKDYDGDGCYSDGGSLDLVLYAGNGGLEAGVALSAFSSDGNVAFVDRNGNGRFDPATEIVLRDLDQNGKVGATADRVVDFDGAISTDPGSAFFQDVELGQAGSLLVTSDRVLTDHLVNPTIVFRDITPYNGIPDGSDQLLVAPAGVTLPTNAAAYVNVATASPQTWYYHDRNDSREFEAGEDLWIDIVAGQPEYLDQSELETILYRPAGAADPVDGESEPAAAQEPLLAYYDADLSGGYDEGEPIVYEQYLATQRGRGYTAQAEGLQPGANGVYSLAAGAAYPVGNALVDEDHGYTVLQPLVDEDLQNRIAYFDEDGVPGFSLRDLDGDNDYFPIYEDLNRNGRLDQIDNNKDGDFDDQDDYNEDLNGDGNLDLGIGGDEVYIDYDGDGLFDPDVGGQLRSVSELFFAGDNTAVQLRASQPYNIKGVKFLAVDEDGDGERGGATVDSRMLVALGLFPALPPFAGSVSIQIPVADGIDNESDGVFDEGLNEDLGDSAFDAYTL
jgi:hypothetical protein